MPSGKLVLRSKTMFDTTMRHLIAPEATGDAEIVAVICPLCFGANVPISEQALEAAAIDVEKRRRINGARYRGSVLGNGVMTKA